SGHTARLVVLGLMARAARHRDRSVIVRTSPHEIRMRMPVVSLTRRIVGRVAVETSRIPKNLSDSAECGKPLCSRVRTQLLLLPDGDRKRRSDENCSNAGGRENQNSLDSNLVSHRLPLEDLPCRSLDRPANTRVRSTTAEVGHGEIDLFVGWLGPGTHEGRRG